MSEIEVATLAIVEQALAHEGDERAAFIERACADDTALRQRVERLLALDETGFRLLPTESFAIGPLVPETLPERIGPYRITGMIGEGGMGAVVMGERDDGVFQQTVAIKLIRRSLTDARTHARFDQERRILGRLAHPGIARILDGGESDGRPWLAMDYLDSEPVTLALARREAGLGATLDAFEAICEAVGHAHRKLVVHADIKPSNVVMDADGSIKLLDFGIARLIVDLDPDEEAAPYPLTRTYAAPERRGGEPPTIAGDIYSLGVLLHEMLTGHLPQEGQVVSAVSQGRLAALQLAGDLDAIVARSLAADPARRYHDVGELLFEIRAFRTYRPVAARQDVGWRYFAGKFLRRHQLGAAVTAGILLMLATTSVISTILLARAETARTEADRRFFEVRELVNYLLFEHYDQLAASPGTVEARVRVAQTAGAYLDQLRQVPDAPADLRLDSARGYRRLALVQGVSGVSSLGDIAAARSSLDKAAALLGPLISERPDDARSLSELGWVEANLWSLAADDEQGLARIDRADRLFSAALALDPALADAELGRITTQRNRGHDLIWRANRPAQAIVVLRNALDRLRSLRLPAASREEARRLEFGLLNRVGDATYYAGNHAEALTSYRSAANIARTEVARRETPFWLAAIGESQWNIGSSLDNAAEGLAELQSGKQAIERALAFGPDSNAEKLLFILLADEANRLLALDRPGDALAASRRSLSLREARLGQAHGDPMRMRDVAIALPNHARILAAAGRRGEGCTVARRAAAMFANLAQRRQLSGRDRDIDWPSARDAVSQLCER